MGLKEREEQRKKVDGARTGANVVMSMVSKLKNEVVLKNGIRHELTGDEILVLQILLERAEPFLKNKDNVTYFDEHREQQILSAAASLRSLFVDHLD